MYYCLRKSMVKLIKTFQVYPNATTFTLSTASFSSPGVERSEQTTQSFSFSQGGGQLYEQGLLVSLGLG
ncbi:hypothetical protein P5673_027517 [Acropora cervicornis]|uniref:Uncharacterized protein n=1 Tax=Acropora cervicornis TaxID=6130 RepID=A0AAD9PYT8_ACRCE|nr:hypothetical protein P5673_027517 [Acropora cervicornis]